MTPATSQRTHALKSSTSTRANSAFGDSAFAAHSEFLTANFTNHRGLTREHLAWRPQKFEFKDAALIK
jgi:hypothetical protein